MNAYHRISRLAGPSAIAAGGMWAYLSYQQQRQRPCRQKTPPHQHTPPISIKDAPPARPSTTTWFRPTQTNDPTPASLNAVAKRDRKHLNPRLQELSTKHKLEIMRHQTPCENLASMLAMGKILPASALNKSRYTYTGGPKKQVFLQLTNEETEKRDSRSWADCTVYVSLQALNDEERYHTSQFWQYGHKKDHFSADGNHHKQTARIVGRLLMPSGELMQNEVVFDKKGINLEKNLRAIKGPRDEVTEALKQSPEVITNPPKHHQQAGSCDSYWSRILKLPAVFKLGTSGNPRVPPPISSTEKTQKGPALQTKS